MIFTIGQALLAASTYSILPHYFNKKLTLVNGILGFFGAIFTIAIAVIMELLLEKYGLTEAFYFLAAINFLASILTITFISMLSKQVCEKRQTKLREHLA